jgi:proteic killer suppression protein
LNLFFSDQHLETLCSVQREQNKQLGKAGARKLRARLADLLAAARVTDLVAGHPHPLTGDRSGQFAVDLDGGRRLVFEPEQQPPPIRDDGALDWHQVTAVCIVYIGDYHD